MAITPSSNTGGTNRTASNAGSAISRSASGVTKAIKATGTTNNNDTSNQETAKDDGATAATRTTEKTKSEVLLTRLLKSDGTKTAEKLAQENQADQMKWQELQRQSQLDALKFQGARANAQLLGSVAQAAAKALGGLMSNLAKKMGGNRAGGGGDEAARAGRGNPSGGADTNESLGRGVNESTATESIAKASQADAEWGAAGATRNNPVEESRMAVAGERENSFEAEAITENFSQQMETNEVEQEPIEIQIAQDEIAQEDYA